MVLGRRRTRHAMTITEIKRHLDGREERYECELLLRTDDAALVRFGFHQDEPREDGPFQLPSGEIVTLAAFWEGHPYLIYRLTDENDRLIGHRFDVCEAVHIDDEIRYTDLLLDVWIPRDGNIYVLDADEIEDARSSGLMDERQVAFVDRVRQYLETHAADVIKELDELAAQANVAEGAEQAEREPGDRGGE